MTSVDGHTLASALEALGPTAVRDAPFGTRTTYRVGGPAAVGFAARTLDDLRLVAEVGRSHRLDWMLVGRGSNLLVADEGYDGIAVWLEGDFERVEFTSDGAPLITAGAAVPLPVLARKSAAAALSGLEWAVGVPGTVGGAVVMNAGGHGSDIASCLCHAEVLRHAHLAAPDVVKLSPAELKLGYRSSVLGATDVVLAATFACHNSTRTKAQAAVAEVVRWRREHQPGGQNAGSVFKNPTPTNSHAAQPIESAAQLIDRAGLKGLRVGSACVSQVHANFIVAQPHGRAADVATLIGQVAATVAARSGVRLELEVRLVGFDRLEAE